LLQKKIIETIEIKYSKSINKLQRFSVDINCEISDLDKFIKWTYFIKNSYISYIFFINEKQFENAEKSIKNLYYLRSLFI